MIPIEILRTGIERDIFDYTQLMDVLKAYKKPRDAVTKLLKESKIIRIRKGLYCFGAIWRRHPLSIELLANLVYGPSIISLDYALSYYGFIPEQVKTITSVVPGRRRFYDTPVGNFSYNHLSLHFFSFGITLEKTNQNQWLIMQPIKALADKVWTDKRFKPSSPASFADYFFQDLRVDEAVLLSFIDESVLMETEQHLSSRKIKWMLEFLAKYKSQQDE